MISQLKACDPLLLGDNTSHSDNTMSSCDAPYHSLGVYTHVTVE